MCFLILKVIARNHFCTCWYLQLQNLYCVFVTCASCVNPTCLAIFVLTNPHLYIETETFIWDWISFEPGLVNNNCMSHSCLLRKKYLLFVTDITYSLQKTSKSINVWWVTLMLSDTCYGLSQWSSIHHKQLNFSWSSLVFHWIESIVVHVY